MPRATRNVIALLERARTLCDPPSWYQLAKRTDIAEATLTRCRRHNGTLGDINAVKLAKFLGMDPATVMAYMAEDRAQDDETRQFWTAQLPRLLPSVALASVALWAVGGTLTDGSTEGFKAFVAERQLDHAMYYAYSGDIWFC
jgi:hypothetical protein